MKGVCLCAVTPFLHFMEDEDDEYMSESESQSVGHAKSIHRSRKKVNIYIFDQLLSMIVYAVHPRLQCYG